MQTYGLYGLFDRVFDLAHYPLAVFRGLTRVLLAHVLPVALAANLPTLALLEGSTATLFLLAGFHAVFWFLGGSLLWRHALTRYTGASSCRLGGKELPRR